MTAVLIPVRRKRLLGGLVLLELETDPRRRDEMELPPPQDFVLRAPTIPELYRYSESDGLILQIIAGLTQLYP
jgi:hypothetical protein